MRFIGVFVNISHAAECLPQVNTNTAKLAIGDFLNGDRLECYEHIFLKYELGESPINTFEIREATRAEAQQKLKIIQVKRKLENTDVKKLTEEEIDILYRSL